MKYHLDEHVPAAIANGLRRRGIDVTTTSETGMIGTSDAQQRRFAFEAERVIFTHDRDFLALGRKISPHAGIVFSKQGTRTIGQIIEHLEFMHLCLTPSEMIDHIEFF